MTALDLTALIVGFGLLFRQFLTLSRKLRESDRDNEALRKNLACVQGELEEARGREVDALEACVGLTEELDAVCEEYGVRSGRAVWLSPGGTG